MATTNDNPEVVPPAPKTPQNSGRELPTPLPSAIGHVLIAAAVYFPLEVRAMAALLAIGLVLVLTAKVHVLDVPALQFYCSSGRAAYRSVCRVASNVYQWFFPLDAFVADVSAIDSDPSLEHSGTVTTPFQRTVAYAFKAARGERRYTAANRLIAEDWVRDYFAGVPDMRDFDKVRLLPGTVELCLLPTKFSVQAAEMAKSQAVKARRGEVDLAK